MKLDIINISAPQNCYSTRSDAISALVLHSVGMELTEVFQTFKDLGVSGHYIIPEISAKNLLKVLPSLCSVFDIEYKKPKILYPQNVPVIRLVSDEFKAFHAGESAFGKISRDRSLNSISLGIEFHNKGYARNGDFYKFRFFKKKQKKTGILLIQHLMQIYKIPFQNIFAHSTISVGRKTDPGPFFFWQELNYLGMGYMPKTFYSKKTAWDILLIQERLNSIGFSCPITGSLDDKTQACIQAYTMQFAPNLWQKKKTRISQALISSIKSFNSHLFL